MHRFKENIFLCVYKMVEISAETWKKCGITTAIFNNPTKNKK